MLMGKTENGLPFRGRTIVRLPGLRHGEDDILSGMDEMNGGAYMIKINNIEKEKNI
jgi:hypothetical protein